MQDIELDIPNNYNSVKIQAWKVLKKLHKMSKIITVDII